MKIFKWGIRPLIVFICLIFCLEGYHVFKKLPEGLDFNSGSYTASDVVFLRDTTVTKGSERIIDQQIFDSIFEMIRSAESLIVIDMFLFNNMEGRLKGHYRSLSRELTDAILEKKKATPAIKIVLITDPINSVYGGLPSKMQLEMKDAGVDIVITDLLKLRDSNPVYSSLWRHVLMPLEHLFSFKISNPFGEGEIPVYSMLRLINFKANHRKVVIADQNGELYGLVTSANPHDGSSAHGNIGVKFNGEAAYQLLESEKSVIRMSGGDEIETPEFKHQQQSPVKVSVVTESKIKKAILDQLKRVKKGDTIDLVMFYLSDREVVQSLISAHQRGALVKVILDPNRDAFGMKKDGVPNRPVAKEMVDNGITVRWANTNGEQCHSKLLMIKKDTGDAVLIGGSSNYTRRNFHYNLETDVMISAPVTASVMTSANAYFSRLWENKDSLEYTVPYEKFKNTSFIKTVKYRFMEFSGISTF